MTIAMDPVLVSWGGFALRWYPLIILASIGLALIVSRKEARRWGLMATDIDDLLPPVLVAGVIGARFFHALDNWDRYAANPVQLLAVTKGGLAIFGALVGGGLATVLFARRRGLEALHLADILTPGLLLALALGRFACLINGDAYGSPTTLPWAITYTNPHAFVPARLLGVPTHPYPIYEMVWDLAVFALVWRRRQNPRAPGKLFLQAAALYAVGRFVLTSVRQEPVVLLGFQEAQVVALVTALAATVGLIALSRQRGHDHRLAQA